jgi:AraC-like DNA-binding protein
LHHRENFFTLTDEKAVFIRRTAFQQEMYDYADWEVLTFYFTDDFLRQTFNQYRQDLLVSSATSPPADMLIPVNVNETSRAFIYSIIPYFNQPLPPSESLLELKFKEMLLNLLSDPGNTGFLGYTVSLCDQQRNPLWQVMEANYMYNLSVEEFARLAGRSIATFKREFQKYYQTTPGKWLTQKRLEHARRLLEGSLKTVGEIADDSGFENVTHFSSVFKKKYGLSPLHYRQKGDTSTY